MKKVKITATVFALALTPTMAFLLIALSVTSSRQREHIEVLLWENLNLRDYKRAYMDHIDKCDTLHSNCVRIGNTEKVLPNVSKQHGNRK